MTIDRAAHGSIGQSESVIVIAPTDRTGRYMESVVPNALMRCQLAAQDGGLARMGPRATGLIGVTDDPRLPGGRTDVAIILPGIRGKIAGHTRLPTRGNIARAAGAPGQAWAGDRIPPTASGGMHINGVIATRAATAPSALTATVAMASGMRMPVMVEGAAIMESTAITGIAPTSTTAIAVVVRMPTRVGEVRAAEIRDTTTRGRSAAIGEIVTAIAMTTAAVSESATKNVIDLLS